MKKKVLFLVIIGLIVFLTCVLVLISFIFFQKQPPVSPVVSQNVKKISLIEEPFVRIGGKKIRIDIADTVATRTQGLSGRTSLADTEGMLFVFENADRYGFWMKDMNFAIDIIWIGPEKNVVYIEKSLSPETYPRVFTPTDQAKYVLEVKAGFSDSVDLRVGDKIEFSGNF